jgi:hypothetical protein
MGDEGGGYEEEAARRSEGSKMPREGTTHRLHGVLLAVHCEAGNNTATNRWPINPIEDT